MPASRVQKADVQLEAFRDIDLEAFALQMRNKASINLEESIVDATIQRTIEGASTLTVTCDDDLERTIQKSGKLGRKVDVNVDGLWFTLIAVRKSGRTVTLTFEDRHVNALRYYNSWKHVSRSKITRAQFVAWMITEVKEYTIPYIIPELKKKQPVSDYLPGDLIVNKQGARTKYSDPEARPPGINDKDVGAIPSAYDLKVKGETASPEALTNANTVLTEGVNMGARRKVLVVAIMTCIQESSLHNYPPGTAIDKSDSAGVFQQRPSQGWGPSGDVAQDAKDFFAKAIPYDQKWPNLPYWQLAADIQRPRADLRTAYGKWWTEANAFVNAYGIAGDERPHNSGDYAGDPVAANNSKPGNPIGGGGLGWTPTTGGAGDYQFYRGNLTQDPAGNGNWILQKQNSWDCMRHLADEVNWRCFCVSGTIYFVSEKWLFQSKPFMVISEDTDGVDWIDYDYDEGKRSATVTVTCHIHRWSAPPGSTVQIYDMGIPNGKWLVNDVSRSLFDDIGTIVLKKPQPVLPEPTAKSQAEKFPFGEVPRPNVPGEIGPSGGAGPPVGTGAQGAINYALAQLGKPYVWGGAGPSGFDCSGLVMAAYSTVGINLPHYSVSQWNNSGPKLSTVQTLQPGDIVFFKGSPGAAGPKDPDHEGLYLGDGKFVQAPHTGDVVKVSDINDEWYKPRFMGATRPTAAKV
jgi:hypothetical protein